MSRLDEALHKLAAELAELQAPSHIEGAVLAELTRAQRNRRVKIWSLAAAVVAALVLTVWIAQERPLRKPAVPSVAELEAEQPFVPIPYVLPPAPYERVEVVRMQVPVAALISAGLPVGPVDPGAQAEADVLVGQDGRPRAVRLISILTVN